MEVTNLDDMIEYVSKLYDDNDLEYNVYAKIHNRLINLKELETNK